MADQSFISLGMQLGAARLTISAESVDELGVFLSALTENDDPDGMAPIDAICDSINTINAATLLKGLAGSPAPAANSASNSPAQSAPAVSGQNCQHGPMKYKEGVGKNGPYKAWFCNAPFGKPKCDAIFIND